MTEKKADMVKSIMINLGVLLILVSTTTARDLGFPFFVLGLILLALQTLELKMIDPKKLVTTEIIISTAVCFSAIIQLIMSKTFGAPQAFLIMLLLGGILVTVEAVRKYADL